MIRYVWLRSLVALGTAVYVFVICRLYGVSSATLWAALTFVGQFIPDLGPIVASIAPVAVAFLGSDEASTGLWVALWLLLGHMFVGYAIEPPLFGKGMDLEPLAVILGLVFFGWMWGIVGALAAVPLLLIIRSVCERIPSLHSLGALLKAHENQ